MLKNHLDHILAEEYPWIELLGLNEYLYKAFNMKMISWDPLYSWSPVEVCLWKKGKSYEEYLSRKDIRKFSFEINNLRAELLKE